MAQDIMHQSIVTTIQRRVRDFNVRGDKVKIYHGTTNSTRPLTFDPTKVVDVSSLNRILEINTREQFVLVEPNVALDQLVDATLAAGFVPPMVAEFPGITVGGAIQGGSGESSSYKHGAFNETCLEYEIVLGNGGVVIASRTQNKDLFWGMACAFGTLGIITLVKIKLVPATKYVRLVYDRVSSFEQATKRIKEQCQIPAADFVDGILFSENQGTIMTGYYTDKADLPKARFTRLWDDWFYLHVADITGVHEHYEEVIPLREYIFRYDRGAFWVAKYGFQHVPFNRLTRLLFAPLFTTRRLYKVLHGSGFSHHYLAQDICLPQESVTPFLEFAAKEFDVYPLWLCPLKPSGEDKLSPAAIDTPLVINVGIWGDMRPSKQTFKERNRTLEREVQRLGGRKVLYAHAYYSKNEFWAIYDKKYYDDLRSKYSATRIFPSVYEKVIVQDKPYAAPSKRQGLRALLKSPFKL